MHREWGEEGRLYYKLQGHPVKPKAKSSDPRALARYTHREVKLSVGRKGR